ncbi:MAG: DNA polymerase/3'-5' exonuclease PolX [Candidatus Omnitrophota bacterium]
MKNALVSDIFRRIAELLEIKSENPFRIRAYLRAAEQIENLKDDIAEYSSQERLGDIPGIGTDLAQKANEILSSGTCKLYEQLKKEIPEGVLALMEVPEIGPKTARLFFEKLNINSLEALKTAAQNGRLATLPGIRQKTVENILKGIALIKKGKERMDLLTATTTAEAILGGLRTVKDVGNISVAGSLRRMKETVRDIDILVASKKARKVTDVFVHLPEVRRVLAEGQTKSSVLTKSDAQVDLRVLEPGEFGAALLYFTGSKNHNIKLRQLAIKRGLKINEYGIFDKKGRCLASRTEEEMYRVLGMDCIEPELREDNGEIEAALNHQLPRLIELKDIKGDLHAHTNYSDGSNTIQEMAHAAVSLGYEYIALTDHSQSLKVAHGLDLARLKKKRKELDRVNKRLKNIRVLFGTEVEIAADGGMDYTDEILRQFDIVVAAIHSGFKQTKKQLTHRLVSACRNKHVHIVAHPTGILRPTRDSYELDFKEIFKAARDTNTALEINAHPYRLDLSDVHSRWAHDQGVRLAIGTDAHDQSHLNYMRFGVGLARRAWLTKKGVLNTLSLKALLKALKK